MTQHKLTLLGGRSHPTLTQTIALHLGVAVGGSTVSTFPDGELFVEIDQSVRGHDLFVVQSIVDKPNDYLVELLITIDALKRASARDIAVVLPYFGYARQDRRNSGRVPITAKLVADLLQTAGATRVLGLDLHAEQLQGFFNIPVDNLNARPLLVEALGSRECVVVAPDAGSAKIARDYAGLLGSDYAIVDKRRLSATQVEAGAIIGDVAGRDVVLTDDMVSTAGTLVGAANACRAAGCGKIVAAVTHGLFVGDALERIANSPIEKIFVTDSVPQVKTSDKLQIVSVGPLFGEAIGCIVSDKSFVHQ